MHDLARTRLEPGAAVGDVGEGVRWQDEQVVIIIKIIITVIVIFIIIHIIILIVILVIRREWLEEQRVQRAFTCLELQCLMGQR